MQEIKILLFMEEQDGNAILEPIVFENGFSNC